MGAQVRKSACLIRSFILRKLLLLLLSCVLFVRQSPFRSPLIYSLVKIHLYHVVGTGNGKHGSYHGKH
nr:hypothetical protein CFP56_53510 [Quercus suber]